MRGYGIVRRIAPGDKRTWRERKAALQPAMEEGTRLASLVRTDDQQTEAAMLAAVQAVNEAGRGVTNTFRMEGDILRAAARARAAFMATEAGRRYLAAHP